MQTSLSDPKGLTLDPQEGHVFIVLGSVYKRFTMSKPKKPWTPKPLSSYTNEQKIRVFNQLYREARDIYKRHQEGIVENGEGDVTDEVQRLGETVLQRTLGRNVFDRWDEVHSDDSRS